MINKFMVLYLLFSLCPLIAMEVKEEGKIGQSKYFDTEKQNNKRSIYKNLKLDSLKDLCLKACCYHNIKFPDFMFKEYAENLLLQSANIDDMYTLDCLTNSDGVNIDVKTSRGQTPLMLAILAKKLEVVNLLIEKGSNINAFDNSFQTPLLYACVLKLPEIVKRLAQIPSCSKDTLDYWHFTPLYYAVACSCVPVHLSKGLEMMEILLKNGANPNFIHDQFPHKGTALLSAVTGNNIEAVKILLNYKADPDLAAEQGKLTPRQKAINDRRFNISNLFEDKKRVKTCYLSNE